MRPRIHPLVAIVLAAAAPRGVDASTPPAGFADKVLLTVDTPTGIAYEPGTGAMFALEKGNGSQARVIRRDAATGTVTTALTLNCVDPINERGLLGIAFDPGYAGGPPNRFGYLYYTREVPAAGACAIAGTSGSRNRVSRFTESGGALSGETVVLEGPVLDAATNHNGGTIRFASDSTLYVSMGDNASGNSAHPYARDLTDLRGKILRIRRDGSIPPDNPFVGQAPKRPEIWAWGLRNPFRFSIDAATQTLWIADVGENTWEEIDAGIPGADYGWPCYEGNAPYRPCTPPPANPVFPVLVYGHSGQSTSFTGNTIIGGPVYRGGNFPASYAGRLFFGDYESGWIRSAAVGPGASLGDVKLFAPDAGAVVDFAQSPSGCLAWADIGTGKIHETCYNGSADEDGDGYTVAQGDCNDHDPTVYPGAPDLCDGKDNDCNGKVDDGTCAQFAGPDGRVDGFVLSLIGRYFGVCDPSPASQPWAAVDYTKDGCIDGNDLSVMGVVWGCSGSEPLCK